MFHNTCELCGAIAFQMRAAISFLQHTFAGNLASLGHMARIKRDANADMGLFIPIHEEWYGKQP